MSRTYSMKHDPYRLKKVKDRRKIRKMKLRVKEVPHGKESQD